MRTAPTSPPRPRWPALTAVTALLLCALAVTAPSRAAAEDEAWRGRIEAALTRVEAAVGDLEGIKAAPGTLLQRIQALQVRIVALETATELAPGTIQAKDDLASCTQDVATLTTRWRKVVEVRRGPPPPPPPAPLPSTPPAAAPPVPPPARPLGRPWPESIAFKVNAKMSYVETGQWYSSEIPYVQPYVYRSQFLTDGYHARVSFTLRAAGLVRDVKSAVIRVAIRLKGPLTQRAQEYRIYDVEWVADRVFGDDSFRSWSNFDELTIPAPPRWVAAPHGDTMKVQAEAYVVSAVLPSGERVTFQTPTWETR